MHCLLLLIPASCFAGERLDIPFELVRLKAQKMTSTAKLHHLDYLEQLAAPEFAGKWREQSKQERESLRKVEDSIRNLENESDPNAPAWISSLGKAPYPSFETALPYLKAHFPKPERLSSASWQAIRELFGNKNQEAFLEYAYGAKPISLASVRAKTKTANEPVLLFIHDPFLKANTGSRSPSWKGLAARLHESEFRKEEALVKSAGFETIDFDASAFESLDAIAAEVGEFIRNNCMKNNKSYIIVSTGLGSAIVHRFLDLQSGSRKYPQIHAWVNYDGRLHGLPLPGPGRSIASIGKESPIEKEEAELASQLLELQEERGLNNPSLGDGFPIYNFVRWDKKNPQAADIQDSFESNAVSYLLSEQYKKGDLTQIILSAIP